MLLVVNDSVSDWSSCTTSVPPLRPVVVTLSVKFCTVVVHVAVTVMLPVIVPLALLLSAQVCPDGGVFTLTV